MIMILVVVVCLAMAYVEIVMAPGYAVKSGIKAFLFLMVPLLFLLSSGKKPIADFFKMKRGGWKNSCILAAIVFLGILGAYYLFRDAFDFSSIAPSLQNQLGINRTNFVFVAVYISIVNSLLEEYFFRGFAFLALKKNAGTKVAYAFSATAFALYHVAIMNGWFSLPLMVLLILSLFVAGIVFNFIDEKEGSILPSWLVHISANFAINAVGFILLGIIPGI